MLTPLLNKGSDVPWFPVDLQTSSWSGPDLRSEAFYVFTSISSVFLFSYRTEAAQLVELLGSLHGSVWWRITEGGHVDRWFQLQSHCPEWEGPKPCVGHQWGLCLFQTPLLCGLVLLEHRNTGELQQQLLVFNFSLFSHLAGFVCAGVNTLRCRPKQPHRDCLFGTTQNQTPEWLWITVYDVNVITH